MTLDTMEKTVALLVAKGFAATLEYPGTTVGDWTSKRILDQNAIRHKLGHMSGMRSRPGTRAGFELDRDQAFGRLDQVIRAAR